MFLQWAIPGTLIPLYSVRLERELGFDPVTTALCSATQAVAAVFSSLLTGQIADRWLSAEKMLSICASLASLILCVLAELRQPIPVFLATFAFWMFTAPMLMLGTTVSFAHLKSPGRQFGPVRMWGTVGWMVVGWVLGLWRGDPLHVGAMIALAVALYGMSLPSTPPKPATGQGHRLAPLQAIKLLKNPSFAIFMLCVLGSGITFPFTTQTTPLLLAELGISRADLYTTLSLAQTTEVIGLGVLPAILQRLGMRGTMIVGLTAWTIAICVLWIGQPVQLIIGSLPLNGLYITGFMVAGQVYLNSQSEGDIRASLQGLQVFVSGMGLLIGNLLAGWLRQRTGGDLPATFATAFAITVGMLLLFLVGFRHSAAPSEGHG
jgi:predicted MFS family arabinose efflux permease